MRYRISISEFDSSDRYLMYIKIEFNFSICFSLVHFVFGVVVLVNSYYLGYYDELETNNKYLSSRRRFSCNIYIKFYFTSKGTSVRLLFVFYFK